MLNEVFKNLINDTYDKKSALSADVFFSDIRFVPGRAWIISSGIPVNSFNKLKEYEELLLKIYEWDQEKYFYIHKGTPFFYCGVHAFDLKLYEKSMFYFDTAISEDLKNKPNNLTNAGAYAIICLNQKYTNKSVEDIVSKLVETLEPLIKEYNKLFSAPNEHHLNMLDITEKFIKIRYIDKSYRSILFAMYSFILEANERFFQMRVRSDFENSVETFITYLLKGCLIFESLLRQTYPNHMTTPGLAGILSDKGIKEDLKYNFIDKSVKKKDLIETTASIRKTLPDIIDQLIPYINTVTDLTIIDKWFIITYALRNVSAHTLSWPDVFDESNFEKLYKSIIFSILHLINRNIQLEKEISTNNDIEAR